MSGNYEKSNVTPSNCLLFNQQSKAQRYLTYFDTRKKTNKALLKQTRSWSQGMFDTVRKIIKQLIDV